MSNLSQIENLLGDQAEYYLGHTSNTISKDSIAAPGSEFVTEHFIGSNRSNQVLNSLSRLYNHGRLGGTGYVSILPVDQGIEHSAAASFAPNPRYFDPANIVELAMEAGCNAVASTFGVLAQCSRKFAHKIPFIVKLNHNEFLTYPNTFNQIMFGSVEDAWEMGATAVGATIYFGSEESERQIQEVVAAFERAHELGMATILWCYLRNSGFKKDGVDYHTAADLTGQANHIGVTIQADIIKQKLPTNNGGYNAIQVGYGSVSTKSLTQPQLGHLQKSNIQPLKYLKEYTLSPLQYLIYLFYFYFLLILIFAQLLILCQILELEYLLL